MDIKIKYMTEKELNIINGFINKQEPKVMEFEEVKAIVKMLFYIYGRLCIDDA